jgi:site-specific DNA-methyltransferase (adenine-specific)
MSADYLTSSQPDILEVIANLSNDAVFTPPRVVNAVLDLLPDEVWTDPTLRWLDPGAKTGVFPREITKRLMVGLAGAIPDDDSRLKHILTEMVFAIATEEITGMMTRRSLYCSKDASSEFSAVRFPSPDGNVWQQQVEHAFNDKGTCTECKGTREDLEVDGHDNKAYAFIHAQGRHKLRMDMNMKFDVIVGNPPYQMTGGGGGTNDTPLYNVFVNEAIKLNPRYVSMIIPSRWMAGGRGLDGFRSETLKDRRLRVLVDYENAKDLFPSVGIIGGVCYFLWDRDNPGLCETTYHRNGSTVTPAPRELDEFDILVRDSRALEILRRILGRQESSLAELVSGDTPFGLATNFRDYEKNVEPARKSQVKLFANEGTRRVQGAMNRDKISKNTQLIDAWKVLLPVAGSGRERERSGVDMVLGPSLLAGPGSVCTQTYLVAGPLAGKSEAESLESYLKTKFARFLVSLRKPSQHVFRGMYQWVPQQTWDRAWTDSDLYKKYDITEDEQAYIAELIREMPA